MMLVLKTIQQVWQCVEEYPDLVGFNVTFPYKEQIIPYLDWIDPLAAQIGAVNVVKVIRTRNHFQMRGYNTDHIGFAATLMLKKRKGLLFIGTHIWYRWFCKNGGICAGSARC